MKRKGKQMSEAVSTGILLTMSGGLQDAYTYYGRGGVFANAQTGNVIILAHNLMKGNLIQATRYLIPIGAFVIGILISDFIRHLFLDHKVLHWRQIILVFEIILLFIVGFLPDSHQLAANSLVSFVCAMQVETFRMLVCGPYASTMCIGNLRSGTELLYEYFRTKDKNILIKSLHYYGIIMVFAIGAVIGSMGVEWLGVKTIWISCLFLLGAFFIMFIKEDREIQVL